MGGNTFEVMKYNNRLQFQASLINEVGLLTTVFRVMRREACQVLQGLNIKWVFKETNMNIKSESFFALSSSERL